MPRMSRYAFTTLVTGLVAIAILAGGCSSDRGASEPTTASTTTAPTAAASIGAAVRPIAAIVVGDIAIVDLSATSAAVSVETSVDVVCSVVFGTDTGYGAQSTDLDMGGGGHSVHRALMRGLEPDTLYHYRLQGSGPDGSLYVSDDLTFRTPAAPAGGAEPDRGGPNVAAAAAGARVTAVSSVFGDNATWAAEHAIDGDLGTEWSSQGDGDRAFITVELAEATTLSAVGLWTRTMTTSAQIRRFQVVTDSGAVLGPFDVPDAAALHVFAVDAVASSLRFEVVESSGGNTGVVELAAYGSAAAP